MKVRSSIPVVRTLSLLGADTWCEVEPCREPIRRPGAKAAGGKTAPVAKRESDSKIAPAARGDSSSKVIPAAKRDAGSVDTSTPPPLEEHKEVFTERRSTVGLNAPGTSIVRGGGKPQKQDALVSGAAARAGLPLVNEDADLADDLSVLKKLVVMKTYTFQMPGLKSDITGKVLARIGGPWILIDTHGAKKMVNVREAAVVDILT